MHQHGGGRVSGEAFGAPGLALATAAGLWIKVVGVFALARRRGWTAPDERLLASVAATLFASGALALALTLADGRLAALMEHLPRFAREARLAALTAIGVAVYFPALGAGLRLTRAVPATLLKRALGALRLAR